MTEIKHEESSAFFEDVETLIFCDETKFSKNDGDVEDAIIYFGVAVPKQAIVSLKKDFDAYILKHKVQARVFHSTTIFKDRHPRISLIGDLTSLFFTYNLHCFSFKYHKDSMYEATKGNFSQFNNDIFNFDNPEFQAFWWYSVLLNTFIRDVQPDLLKREIWICFDRNVYGRREIEAFNSTNSDFVFKRMTHVQKDLISLLAFPDFFGYMFRKTKQHQNKIQMGNSTEAPTKLTLGCQKNIFSLAQKNLFHRLDVDMWISSLSKEEQ